MGCGASSPAREALKEVRDACRSNADKASAVPVTTGGIKKLTRLDLEGCEGINGEEGGQLIARALPHLPVLEEIVVSRTKLGTLGIVSLTGALSAGTPKTLRRLALSNCIDQGGWTAFEALSNSLTKGAFAGLTSLDVSENMLKPQGAICLASYISTCKPPLNELLLADAHVGPSGCIALMDAVKLLPKSEAGSLKLDLFSNQVGPTGATAIAAVLQSESAPRVTHLSVQGGALGADGIAELAAGMACSLTAETLDTLDISSNGMGQGDERAKGTRAFAQVLATHPPTALRALNLAENDLHNGEPIVFIDALKHADQLRWLDLSYNHLRPEYGASLLQLAAALPSLETLAINENPMLGDEMLGKLLQGLAERTLLPKLQHLHICNTGCGSAATKAAMALIAREGGSLARLDMRENPSLQKPGVKDFFLDAIEEAKQQPPIELLLPGDESPEPTLGLNSRKMWSQWLGEKIFLKGDNEGAMKNQASIVVGDK